VNAGDCWSIVGLGLHRNTTDGLGNLDFDVIGTADSLTGDVMFIVVVVVVVIIVIVAFVFVLLSAWWIGSGRV
jgi:hypothetical protein